MISCFIVVKNNFKRNLNKRTKFIINLILPIIIVILGIFANSVSKPSFTIGIINDEQSVNIVEMLSKTDGITIAKANPESIKIDLITGKYSAVVDLSNLDYKLHSIKNEQINEEIKQIIDNYKSSSELLNIEEIAGVEISVAQRIIAFMVLFLMVTSTITASLIIKDKNNGTLKRYKYSPQKHTSYIFGNFIYNYLITFSQFLISTTFIHLMGINIGFSYINLFLMGVWLCGIVTSFGTFISCIFREEMYANLFASLIALVLSLIGGTFIAYENMPILLQKMSLASPFHWFIDITSNLESGMNWFHNMNQVTILTAMIIGFILIASYMNKRSRAS